METKFKIGDKVLITKPTNGRKWVRWIYNMDVFIGTTGTITDILFGQEGEGDCYEVNEIIYWFHESWLTKVEEQPTEQVTEQVAEQVTEQVAEQVTEQVAKPIDWEQRRWDLASKIYAEMENVTLESSVRQAEIFIKYYKQTLK